MFIEVEDMRRMETATQHTSNPHFPVPSLSKFADLVQQGLFRWPNLQILHGPKAQFKPNQPIQATQLPSGNLT